MFIDHRMLRGHGVTLRALRTDDAGSLFHGIDAELWAGFAAPMPRSESELADLFAGRIARTDALFFAVIDEATGRVAGTTSLYDIVPDRAEIGHTFFLREYWGSHVNSASKLLLLGHAFESLAVARVAFRCDARNQRSARAIARLGAVYEGTLRHQRRDPFGNLVDTMYFSILAEEWLAVKAGLETRLGLAVAA